MKNKNGYLLLESVVSLSIIVTLCLVLYSLLAFCINTNKSIEDKIEIQQQALEIGKHIKSTIEKSKGIISVKYDNSDTINEEGINLKSTTSIKCKYRSENEPTNSAVKNKEISYKINSKKIFINTLNSKDQSEVGGYEIGDYVDKIYVFEDNNKFINIKLKLCKNNEIYETKFKVYIRNFEGGL